MMIRLVVAIVVLGVLFWTYKRWKMLPPARRKSSALTFLVYALVFLTVIAVISGRVHWLGAVAAGALALTKIGFSTILRLLPFLNFLRKTPMFSQPVFSTAFLKVQLDINSGQLTGEIINGPLCGKQFEQLSDDELVTLEQHYQSRDKRSYYLIRVLRQRRGQHYQRETHYASVEAPSLKEAEQILGLPQAYSKEDVIRAHKSLMQKLHPDRGGNDYLASRVNTAKDIILASLKAKS